MNARRKTRSTSARGGRGGKGAERQVSADGVYTNHRFMQAVGALVGLPVRIQTKTNEIIEGVFTTFSPNFDLVLDLAHQVSRSDPATINPETIKPKMIFTAADIVTIKVVNVDLDYATRDGFAVDQVISRYNGQTGEKALEPWQGDPSGEDCIGLGDENSNGWDVDDMFRKNEEKYGVTTSYTPDMEGYTTRLFKLNTPEYKEREAKASRIAAEIEKSPTTQVRSEAENGDEEERFSAVIRPGDQGGKYIPPMMRKKNQNGGKAQRSTPPPSGARYNSHGSSNPPTPTSPYPGPPQSGSASHSPVGLAGTSAYQPQQAPQSLPNHTPAPAQHPPVHRNNSQGPHHPHVQDTKVNGDNKTSYERKTHDGPPVDAGREVRHNSSHSGKQQQDLHSRHHGPPHPEPAHTTQQQQQQQSQQQHQKPIPQKPPPQQHHQHSSHVPPVGQGDHRKAEPREQREPRKMRNREEQIADLKKFSEDFKLSDQPEKKPQGQQQSQQQQQQLQQPPQQQHQQHQHQHQQPPPPPAQQLQQHQQPLPTSQQPPQPQQQPHTQPQSQPPPPQPQQQQPPPQQQQQPPQPPQLQQPPPPTPQQHHQHHQQQPPPPPQQPQPPPPQQQQQPPIPQTHLPPQHLPPQQHPQPQRQTPPVTSVTMGPPQAAQQPPPHHPQNPPTMTMNPATEISKPHEEMEKMATTVTHSKLNPNAKEFVFNPHAKPFSPRSPSTTTPPRPHTPQTPQIPPNQPPQMAAGPPMGIPMVLTSQSFAIQSQPPRFPKRVPVNSQRPEYTSPLQVAAATGQPILAPAPMGTQSQPITAVQIPQNIMPQTPQHYQYPTTIMMRFPHAGMPMVTAMVPTSMGLCHPNPDSQQPSQQHGHQTMYMAQTSLPPHQPHPAHTPGPVPQPTQPPTPQNPGGGSGPPNMPNPPSTPGPTPPQSIIYPMGGQPSLPQHLPQHSPHTAPSPHTQQYPGPGQGPVGAGGHHGGPGQQMTTQYVVLPPHMMHHSGPPPHSAAAHIPSSMPGFTPTSTATVQQLPSGPHIQYFPSTPGSHGHPMSLVHHSQ